MLDVRRPIWSLGSMMDSGCDVHFTKNRCWMSKDDGKKVDMIRSGGVFFAAAEVEQAALAREHATFGTPGPTAGATLDGDGEPTVRIRVPTGPATPSAEERALHEASGHVPYRSWCQWCIAVHHQVRYFCNCCNILNLLFTFSLFLILFLLFTFYFFSLLLFYFLLFSLFFEKKNFFLGWIFL